MIRARGAHEKRRHCAVQVCFTHRKMMSRRSDITAVLLAFKADSVALIVGSNSIEMGLGQLMDDGG